eukprot:GHVL01044889.1.p1 GENE.GHVL01044889.1~~GHVL01044889.1.p1  ORF type:complete len:226 (+),score=27.74 GHVL01044889.1:33-710(+)
MWRANLLCSCFSNSESLGCEETFNNPIQNIGVAEEHGDQDKGTISVVSERVELDKPGAPDSVLGDSTTTTIAAETTRETGTSRGTKRADEKKKLQTLVKTFAKQAVKGVQMNLVDCDNGEESYAIMQMDSYLTKYKLTWDAPKIQRDILIKNISRVYQADEMQEQFPELEAPRSCVGLEITNEQGVSHLIFRFSLSSDRNNFFTCTKILRLAADVNPSPGEGNGI